MASLATDSADFSTSFWSSVRRIRRARITTSPSPDRRRPLAQLLEPVSVREKNGKLSPLDEALERLAAIEERLRGVEEALREPLEEVKLGAPVLLA
jgi:hypothetical protein